MEFSQQIKNCFTVMRENWGETRELPMKMHHGLKTVRVEFLDSKGKPVAEHVFANTDGEWLEYRALVNAELNKTAEA